MHNQQSIIARISELEDELRKIKTEVQKTPVQSQGFVWGKINLIDSQVEAAKDAVFDFDIDKFVTSKDITSWK